MTTAQEHSARYQLGAALGRGGQGRTFRALDRQTGQQVAVKLIRLSEADGWKPFDLFERECRVLRSLDHDGIPDYIDSYSEPDDGAYYLVMELVEGQSLKRQLDDQRSLTDAQLWNYLHQALEVLQYLHGLNPPVIHRDIKPANLIFREQDGRLMLVDFGGVRVALRPDGGSTVIGTFGYMAPEQLHGEATPATDIYGLGATLAALASGVEADKLPRKGLKIALQDVMLASPLRALLDRMLEPNPEQRLATVAAVQQAARQGAGGKAAAVAPGPLVPRQPGGDLGPLTGIPGPLVAVLRLFGSLGYMGLVIADSVLLPLIYAMLGSHWSNQPGKLHKLDRGRQGVRKVIRGGRRSMKALARGKNPYGKKRQRQLPPHKRR